MMMKRVLLTGGTGFIGRNIRPYLEKTCHLFAPKRVELDLYDQDQIRKYIVSNKIDIIVNAANPNPVKNSLDKAETMFEDSIRMFMNFYMAQDYYEMMYTLGSGAEYDKSKDICSIQEKEEWRSIPYDSYGLMKFTINQIIANSEKQCNLRVFGCYGPTDHESKFITHAIRCCLRNENITIRQNCFFDYMQVMDLAKIVKYFIYNKPKYRSYNVCTGTRVSLTKIACIVREQMKSENEIIILSEGFNKEYTASNKRLMEEIQNYRFISLEEGIAMQIAYEKGISHEA